MAARGVVAGAIVVMTVAPAEAQPARDRESRFAEARQRIVKIIKKLTVATFGDLLSDPKP